MLAIIVLKRIQFHSYSPVILGLIITLVVITGVLISAITIVLKQMQAYREDVENYRVLQGYELRTEVEI